jgi:hypothetical protein
MKQDQEGRIWKNNKMIGFVDDEKLFGISPITGCALQVTSWNGLNAVEGLRIWLRPFTK